MYRCRVRVGREQPACTDAVYGLYVNSQRVQMPCTVCTRTASVHRCRVGPTCCTRAASAYRYRVRFVREQAVCRCRVVLYANSQRVPMPRTLHRCQSRLLVVRQQPVCAHVAFALQNARGTSRNETWQRHLCLLIYLFVLKVQ